MNSTLNTKEEFITLGSLKLDDDWKKEDINITVIGNFDKNQSSVIEFNTVTGAMRQTFFKIGEGTLEYEFQYKYLCKPASRLIP